MGLKQLDVDCVPFIVAVTFSDILERSVLIQSVVIWRLPLFKENSWLFWQTLKLFYFAPSMQSVILYSLEKNRKTVKECSYLTEKPSHSFYWSILSKELQNQSKIRRLRETIFFRYGSKSYSRHVNFWKKDVFVLSRACNKEKSLSPYAESDYGFLLRPTVLCLTLNPTYALWKKTQVIVYIYTDNINEFINFVRVLSRMPRALNWKAA